MMSVRLTQCSSNESAGGTNFHIPYGSVLWEPLDVSGFIVGEVELPDYLGVKV